MSTICTKREDRLMIERESMRGERRSTVDHTCAIFVSGDRERRDLRSTGVKAGGMKVIYLT